MKKTDHSKDLHGFTRQSIEMCWDVVNMVMNSKFLKFRTLLDNLTNY